MQQKTTTKKAVKRYGDLTGKVFHRLTVIEKGEPSPSNLERWTCQYSCGNRTLVIRGNLISGHTKSCGCLAKERTREAKTTHGLMGTYPREYKVWEAMKRRCLVPTDKSFPDYGGRGIYVCGRWLNRFDLFMEDMGPRPSDKHTLERVDNNRGYEPNNCRWETRDVQANNKSNNRRLTLNGKTKTITEWAKETGLSRSTIRNRVYRGWPVHQILNTPKGERRKC